MRFVDAVFGYATQVIERVAPCGDEGGGQGGKEQEFGDVVNPQPAAEEY